MTEVVDWTVVEGLLLVVEVVVELVVEVVEVVVELVVDGGKHW